MENRFNPSDNSVLRMNDESGIKTRLDIIPHRKDAGDVNSSIFSSHLRLTFLFRQSFKPGDSRVIGQHSSSILVVS